MLTRASKVLIPATLTVKGQGEELTFNVTYHNRTQSEIEAKVAEEGNTFAHTLLFMVESWESEFPLTVEGINELNSERPGVVLAVIQGFHDARRFEKVKN